MTSASGMGRSKQGKCMFEEEQIVDHKSWTTNLWVLWRVQARLLYLSL